MNVTRWNPFAELDEFLGRTKGLTADDRGGSVWQPRVDIRETDSAYLFDVEVPAVAREDLSVSVRAGVLSVSGERAVSEDDSEGQVHRRECRYGKFTRSFRLPNDADEDEVNASSKDGVVTVSVAKRKQSQPRAIEVAVG